MLEAELFAMLERTADAAYVVTASGEIRSWNAAAERLFGWPREDVVGRDVDEVLAARDALGTSALGGGADAATRRAGAAEAMPSFDLEVRTRAGERIWVNVSTIVVENARARRRLFVRLARDVSHHHRRAALLQRAVALGRELAALTDASDHAPVESLSEQERRILSLFARGRDAAGIARTLRISPQTLRNHLHHINRKLRTHSRVEAVTHALRRGLIE